jgi:O-antigen/teichoic acid export membrane protein
MIIISSVLSMQMVGVYKVYKEIAKLLTKVADPINQSLYPEFTKLLGDNNIKVTASVVKKTILLLSIVSAIITLTLILMSKLIIIKFFGNEYLVQIAVLYALLLIQGLTLITSPINSLFIAAGFAKFSFIIVLLSNTAYLISAILFSHYYGIYGLVVAFTIQWIVNKGFKLLLLKKYSNEWGRIIM